MRDVNVLVPGGEMGETIARAAGFATTRVIAVPAIAAPAIPLKRHGGMIPEGAEFIVFAGGDGTARDIHSAVGERLPLLGIPTGVKMQSGVFATSAAAAGRLLVLLLSAAAGGRLRFAPAEVVDLDRVRSQSRPAGAAPSWLCTGSGGALVAAAGRVARPTG